MSTYTDIRYDYNLPSGSGGGLTLLQTNTITSGVASSSFTSGIDSSYRTYLFKFINIHPATVRAEFQFNMSTDGGSNYNVTKTSTYFQAQHGEHYDDTSFSYNTSHDLAQSTSYQDLAHNIGNSNDEATSGELYLFSPSSTTFVKHFICDTNEYQGSDYTVRKFLSGYCNTTSAIDAIDFKFSSGNIDSGIIKMYGIA